MLPLLLELGHATLPLALSNLVQAGALALLIGAIDLTVGRRLRASLRQALITPTLIDPAGRPVNPEPR